MIYSVNGTVDLIEPNLAVIDCGGVGYACRTTANTLSQQMCIRDRFICYIFCCVMSADMEYLGASEHRISVLLVVMALLTVLLINQSNIRSEIDMFNF